MFRISIALVALLLSSAFALAQTPVVVIGPDGKPMTIMVNGAAGQAAAAAAAAEAKEGDGESEGEGEDGKEGETKGDEEPPEPTVIRREDIDGAKADPSELKAEVGKDGKVAFQFRNQPWVQLVQWLSDISGQPLDWLELPADKVNLASPGRYTVAETKDLFNRHLLARGYTILELDGGMTIVSCKAINPAMVRRVAQQELADLSPHTFVRTSFDVGWLSAQPLSVELAGMISTNGRLTPLATTNRIEAMDSAINLRHVAKLLDQELDSSNVEALAPEFKLRYLGAIEAKRMLEEFLGVEKKKSGPMTTQQMQMMMRLQQQSQGKTQKKSESISIVANTRQNSIIVRAPKDRAAVAMEFLKRIDVPTDTLVSLADAESRIQVFQLQSLDPEKLMEIIGEMNVLEPTSKVRPDEDNNALIVSASAADRYIIQRLIDRLDTGPRGLEVLQLRRLDANEVAESIAFLMGQKDSDDDSSRRRSWWYDDSEDDKETDEFRVAANARFRQVLLWANKQEMDQVQNLLVKLGELPPPGGSARTTRVIDASATPETFEYLQRLQKQWNRISPDSKLEIPGQDQFKDPIKEFQEQKKKEREKEKEDAMKGQKNQPIKVEADDITQTDLPTRHLTVAQPPIDPELPTEPPQKIQSAQDFDRIFRPDMGKKKPESKSPASSKIRIEIDENGNLVLSSSNTKALDRLEMLMLRMKPPKRPYHVFKIEHASSYWVRLNLEDYFKSDDDDGDNKEDDFYRWYFDIDDKSDDGPSGLGRGNRLRFIDDPDTNTIVVSGSTSEQLRTIAELIELWDIPEPINQRKMRFMRLVSLKYGKAEVITETVKEAYRDILSSNDKSFRKGSQNQGGGGDDKRKDVPRNRDGNGSGLTDQKNGNQGGGSNFSFKGKLALGVDPVGNTILVSAEGEPLMDLVCDTIDQLDQAAKTAGEYQVLQLPGDVSGASVIKALESFGAKVKTESLSSPKASSRRSQRSKQAN